MKPFCIASAIAAIALFAYLFQYNAPDIINWINTLGWLAPLFFILLYCLATLLFFPTTALTLTGGALFGPIYGTLINLLGATLGATCAFFISRHLIFNWLAAKKNHRINALTASVERRGWQLVALLRLVPIIPFSLVNYCSGATRIKFSHYLIATVIFLIPTEIVFTYCGFAGMSILTHPANFYKNTSLIGLLCLALLLLIYIRSKRNRLLLTPNPLSTAPNHQENL